VQLSAVAVVEAALQDHEIASVDLVDEATRIVDAA
jgi:hypothetical protein